MQLLNSKQLVFNKSDFEDYLNPNVSSYNKDLLSSFIDNLVGIYLNKKKVLNVFKSLFNKNPNKPIRISL